MQTATPTPSAATEGEIHSPAPKANPPMAQELAGKCDESLSDMADIAREVAIQHAAREIEEHMRLYAETGDLGERGAADRARLHMEALIRGRSPARVAQMERERGRA